MKKIVLVIGIVMLCFSVNAFADEWETGFRYGFSKGFLCGRAYQLGRNSAIDGERMLSRTEREANLGIFVPDPSNAAVLLSIHESYEQGYLDGANTKGKMIRPKDELPMKESPSVKY